MAHRILIVETAEAEGGALARPLALEGYDVVTATTGENALALLDTYIPDLVITDLEIPSVGGSDFIHAFRERFGDAPLIVVSTHNDTPHLVEGFHLGADDFLSKPVNIEELVARIDRHLYRSVQQQEAVQQSVSDELTGMLNRRGIANFFRRVLLTSADALPVVSVMVVDVDKFKSINDQHGHLVGDLALCAVARTLQDTIRASDRVGRIGGDEFLLVLPGAGPHHLAELVGRLRARLPIEVPHNDHARLRVSISLGGATAEARESFDTVIERADRAMYADKAS
jgi:diguanylate cyclase (GGDEF)-like protein